VALIKVVAWRRVLWNAEDGRELRGHQFTGWNLESLKCNIQQFGVRLYSILENVKYMKHMIFHDILNMQVL
jgi:hypothetical protein